MNIIYFLNSKGKHPTPVVSMTGTVRGRHSNH